MEEPLEDLIRPNLSPEFGSFVLADEADWGEAGVSIRPYIFRNMHEMSHYPTVQVRHGAEMRELGTAEGLAPDRDAVDHAERTMQRWGLVGLLVVQGGDVIFERYRGGNTRDSKTNVQSITKSVTSTLVGTAVHEGLVSLEDDIADVIPELRGGDYAGSTVRSLLDMAPGVRDPGQVGPTDHIARRRAVYRDPRPGAVVEWLTTHRRYAEPGEHFEYSDYHYFLAAEAVRRLFGAPYEHVLSRKIWAPAGMQHDAFLRTTGAGDADGHGGLSMTLRDLARLGLFAMDSLRGSGGPEVPRDWFPAILDAATSPHGDRAPGSITMPRVESTPALHGYELGWWTHPANLPDGDETGSVRGFAGHGYFGQTVEILADRDAVIVSHSANVYHSGKGYDEILAAGDVLLGGAGR